LITIGCVTGLAELPTAFSNRLNRYKITPSVAPARTLAEIRRSLGIRPHENMITAEVVVVVEGLTEERTFPALLAHTNRDLRGPLASGRVRVLSTGGASTMLSVVRALARDAASCVVFLDSDEEGMRAADRIRSSGLLQPNDVFRAPQREGCTETEYEDLFDFATYEGSMNTALSLALSVEDYTDAQRRSGGRRNRCGKWSEVMAIAANSKGLEWDTIVDQAKEACANGVLEAIQTGDLAPPEWIEGIADRVSKYLREERLD
jgi:hypothetical protein